MKGNREVVIEAKKSNETTLILPALILLITCGYIFFVPEIDILPWFEQYNEKRVLECILLMFFSYFKFKYTPNMAKIICHAPIIIQDRTWIAYKPMDIIFYTVNIT